jgi:hypothetical protein
MAAIITNPFRLENASNFKEAVLNESVYLGIGKSDHWATTLSGAEVSAPTPVDTLVERNDFWQNAIAFKKVDSANTTHLIPRYNWTSGTTYAAWDDAAANIFTQQFYVVTDVFNVYKLIYKTTTGASTVKPSHTNTAGINPVNGGDGYFWKFMYTLTGAEVTSFMTNNYMPVKTVVLGAGQAIQNLSQDDQTRYTYQQDSAGNAGKIYRIVVENQGTGYSANPTVTITGDGSGATATATVSGGAITGITVTANGANYNVVNVAITDSTGTNATARAVLSPKNGHGTDPVAELGGFYIGLRILLSGAEGGDFIVNGGQFRQLGIVKNPYDYGTTTVSTATTLSALKSITLSSVSNNAFVPGGYITGAVSGAKAFIDSYDQVNAVLKIHQNDKTGYVSFSTGENVSVVGGGSGSVGTQGNPEIRRFSGDVIFVESRAAITRSASQLEDIKVIIEF